MSPGSNLYVSGAPDREQEPENHRRDDLRGSSHRPLAAACCTRPTVQQREQNAQTADTQSLDTNQPIPHYNYSQIRQTLIDAETISANGTQTTSFFFQMGDPDPVFTCPSLGMPVANTAQLSNPSSGHGVSGSYRRRPTTFPQEDPYGIYTPPPRPGPT